MHSQDEVLTPSEFGLACEVLDLLAQVPLERRQGVIDMAATLAANEEERHQQAKVRKLTARLTQYGCQIRELPRDM